MLAQRFDRLYGTCARLRYMTTNKMSLLIVQLSHKSTLGLKKCHANNTWVRFRNCKFEISWTNLKSQVLEDNMLHAEQPIRHMHAL